MRSIQAFFRASDLQLPKWTVVALIKAGIEVRHWLQVNSPWFRLYLYDLLGEGPPSLLITKGTRLRRLHSCFRRYKYLLLCTWSHEPGVIASENCLLALNDALLSSCVFLQVSLQWHTIKHLAKYWSGPLADSCLALQAYSDAQEGEDVVHLPFPFTNKPNEGGDGATCGIKLFFSLLLNQFHLYILVSL